MVVIYPYIMDVICMIIYHILWSYYWLVVSNTAVIFHVIYGLSSFPLTNSIIFQRGRSTTNQIYLMNMCFFLVDILLDTMLISQAIMCGKKIAHLGNWGSWNSGAWTINSTKKPWGKVGDENTYDWDQLYTVCFSCWGEWDIHFLSQKMEFCHILNEDIYPTSHEKKQFCSCCSPKNRAFPWSVWRFGSGWVAFWDQGDFAPESPAESAAPWW